MNLKKNHYSRRALALLLTLVMCVGMIPTAFAAQQNSYHDPAEHWMQASGRTNELDANSVVTRETFKCGECGKATSFEVFRVPEYTRNGQPALSRNVKYSDGTMVDGVGKGDTMDGVPGKDATYTGYHYTKAVCETCGGINTNMATTDYGYLKNVYWLYDCAAEFTQKLDETVSYEYTDDTYHTATTKGGTYCAFCYGTNHTVSRKLERHSMVTEVLPQPANGRFATVEKCSLCDYARYDYTAAKAVIADYYGVVDGKPHTITVSDLSEAGVRTSVRYGNSADSCTMTSAPNYTEEGQYMVYYEITYTYKGKEMTENGVAKVWLRDESTKDDGSCACGCGNPNCGCQNKNCNGNCCADKGCGENHKYILLDSTKAGCTTLGYDRYLCTDCGKIEKRDYVDSLGHAWQSIVIRDATCEADGKQLELCSRCGQMKQTATPKGEHSYEVYTVAATCTSPGYTVRECSVCGDRHIEDITAALPHDYESHVIAATCENGGKTIHRCDGCGSSFVTDYPAEVCPGQGKGPSKSTTGQDKVRKPFRQQGRQSGILCRPRIFFAGGDAAEKGIPNNGSGTCAVPLYPCDMGGAADRPVPWRRSAGAAIKLNCRAGTALPDPMDRQESVVHSRLHRRVSHGAVSLCFRTGQDTGRRGTRLRRMGLAPAA